MNSDSSKADGQKLARTGFGTLFVTFLSALSKGLSTGKTFDDWFKTHVGEGIKDFFAQVSWTWIGVVGSVGVLLATARLWVPWFLAVRPKGRYVILKATVAETQAKTELLKAQQEHLKTESDLEHLQKNATDSFLHDSDAGHRNLPKEPTEVFRIPDRELTEAEVWQMGWLDSNQSEALGLVPFYRDRMHILRLMLRLEAKEMCLRARSFGAEIPERVMEFFAKRTDLIPKRDLWDALCQVLFASPGYFRRGGDHYGTHWCRQRLIRYHDKGIATVHRLADLTDESRKTHSTTIRRALKRIERELEANIAREGKERSL